MSDLRHRVGKDDLGKFRAFTKGVRFDQLAIERAGETAIWEAALEQTKAYDLDREISIVVSAPTPGGACVVMPAIVPRLF